MRLSLNMSVHLGPKLYVQLYSKVKTVHKDDLDYNTKNMYVEYLPSATIVHKVELYIVPPPNLTDRIPSYISSYILR